MSSVVVILGFVPRTECLQARCRKKIPARKATIIGTGMLGRRRLSDSMVEWDGQKSEFGRIVCCVPVE